MSLSRRQLLAVGATGAIGATAGCVDFVTGSGPLEFDSQRAAPSADALEQTGYDEGEINEEVFEETVEFVVEREIRASFWVSLYTKTPDIDPADVDPEDLDDTDLSEFDDDAIDDEFDDDDFDEEDLPDDVAMSATASAVSQEFGGGPGPSEDELTFALVSMPDISILGRSFNPIEEMDSEELLEDFLGDAGLENLEREETTPIEILDSERDVDVFTAESNGLEVELLITSFGHEDDYLILLGGYPSLLADEREDVETLLGAVEHPVAE